MRREFISQGQVDTSIRLVQGFVKDDGTLSVAGDTRTIPAYNADPVSISHAQAVTTEPIYGGKAYYIRLAGDSTAHTQYRIISRTYYDRETGAMIQHNPYFNRYYNTYDTIGNQQGVFDGNSVHKSMYVRLTIILTDDGNTLNHYITPIATVLPTDRVVETFRHVYPLYWRRMASDIATYANARYRAKQLSHLTFAPVAHMPVVGTVTDGYWYLKGQQYVGTPYSEVGQWAKWLGQYVGFRQFVTACRNKRSLAFTEQPDNGVSGYNITYENTDLDAWPSYFGTVCSPTVLYVLGYTSIYSAAQIGAFQSYSDVTSSVASDISNLRPLDVLYFQGTNSHHVMIVTDIWLDADGNVGYIELVEGNTLFGREYLVTPEEYAKRTTNVTKVLRMPSNRVIPPAEATPFIWQEPDDDITPLEQSEYICTFAGDYATFAKGDKIFLNVKNVVDGNTSSPLFNQVKVERYENDSWIHVAYVAITSQSYTADSDGEAFADIDISSLQLQGGSYRATALSPVGGAEVAAGYTYFEVVDVEFEAYYDGGMGALKFVPNYGTPTDVAVLVKKHGYPVSGDKVKLSFTASELRLCTSSISASGGSSGQIFRLRVQGQYGAAAIDVVWSQKTDFLTSSSYTEGDESTGKMLDGSGSVVTGSAFTVSKMMKCTPGNVYRYERQRRSSTTFERIAFYDEPWANLSGMSQSDIDALTPMTVDGNPAVVQIPYPSSSDTNPYLMTDVIAPAGATCMRLSYLTLNAYPAVVTLGAYTPPDGGTEGIGSNGTLEF